MLAREVSVSELGSELSARSLSDQESVGHRSKSLNMGQPAWVLSNREVPVRQNQGCAMFVDDSSPMIRTPIVILRQDIERPYVHPSHKLNNYDDGDNLDYDNQHPFDSNCDRFVD